MLERIRSRNASRPTAPVLTLLAACASKEDSNGPRPLSDTSSRRVRPSIRTLRRKGVGMNNRLLIGVVLCLVAACSTEPGNGGGGGGGNTLAIAKGNPSGDGQSATVATTLPNPLRVLVTQGGSPLAGRTVTWSASAGSSVTASSTTDASGVATAQWTLGQAAQGYTATASLSGATGSPLSFTATATPGPAANLAKVSGDGQTGIVNSMLADPLVARVTDQFNNPVSGSGVMWQVTNGTATVNPASSTTGGTGAAQTVVTLGGSAGAITIQAVSTGLTGSPLSYTATANTLPVQVTVQVTNNVFTPSSVTIAAGGTVTWHWPASATNPHNVSPDGTEPTRSGNPVTGPNTYQYTFNTPGVYQYFCEVHGAAGGIGMSGTVTVQ